MRKLIWFPLLILTPLGSWAGADPHLLLERAGTAVQQGRLAWARSLLQPVVIHPALSAGERSKAYYTRAFSFLQGGYYVSARKDFNRALEFNPSNAAARVALGDLHLRGLGTVKNVPTAFAQFEQAAELGSPQGALYAGRALLLGEGTNYDVVAARQWLEVAADAGYSQAMSLLGTSYREPYAEPSQPQLAKVWYEKAAAVGELSAAVSLAHMLESGELGEPDHVAACAGFSRAAEAGSADGHASYAHCLLSGEGVARDLDQARRHFRRAAAGGHSAGYLGLGYLYEHGLGVEADREEAEGWYERAAQGGSVRGQYDLARLLLKQGDEKAELAALRWLAAAVQEGDPAISNAYAWVLATSRFDGHRDAHRAVQFAEYAVAKRATGSRLDTLAAAYAEAGRWEEAVRTQEQALASSSGEDGALAERLERYRSGQPWRE